MSRFDEIADQLSLCMSELRYESDRIDDSLIAIQLYKAANSLESARDDLRNINQLAVKE